MSKYNHNSPVLHEFYKNLRTNIVFKRWYFHQKLGEKPQQKRVISMEYQPFMLKRWYNKVPSKLKFLRK